MWRVTIALRSCFRIVRHVKALLICSQDPKRVLYHANELLEETNFLEQELMIIYKELDSDRGKKEE